MPSLEEMLSAPTKADIEAAAFNIFARMASQEPHGNAYDQARTAFFLADAFFEIRKERRERG